MKSVSGYIEVEARGRGIERLLNLAVSRGILLWDIKMEGDKAYFKTYPKNFRLLRPLCKKTDCLLKIKQKKGLPFFIHSYKRRKGLVVGSIIFLFTLYFLSNFIWFIDVQGEENLDKEAVIESLRETGVYPGILKGTIDFDFLERELMLQKPDLSWVGFRIHGTRLIVEAYKKSIPPDLREKDITSSDIVAAKRGIVENIIVYSGESQVDRGDMVEKEQLLITGVLMGKDDEGNIFNIKEVRSRGEVLARINYDFFATVPLQSVEWVRTGSKTRAFNLMLPRGKELYLGAKVSPYKNYDVEEIKHEIRWRNIALPIELNNKHFYELTRKEQEHTREEAWHLAVEELFIQAESYIPADAQVIDYQVRDVSREQEVLELSLRVETLEDIALERDSRQ